MYLGAWLSTCRNKCGKANVADLEEVTLLAHCLVEMGRLRSVVEELRASSRKARVVGF
jgi:hypothetical protein